MMDTDKPPLGGVYLAHFGTKGMKWGQRKSGVSRKQNRQMNKEAEGKFNAKKASTLYSQAKKGGNKVLVEIQIPGDHAKTIITGKEFARHMESGGAMNVRTTEIFARQTAPGKQFVLNANRIGNYEKQDFRKTS